MVEKQPFNVYLIAPNIKYRDWAPGHFAGPDGSDGTHGSGGAEGSEPRGGALKQLRPWPPSAVIQSLIGAGLELVIFHEYPDSLVDDWTAYPRATPAERARIASTYAVMARKPERQA